MEYGDTETQRQRRTEIENRTQKANIDIKTEMQRYRDTEIQGYRDKVIQRCRDTERQRHICTET
jgi:hypothetical protein